MHGTALVYSSHDRCNFIHDQLIVQRALRGNKHILFLPMSETVVNGNERERQDYSWGRFAGFFRHYERYGLRAFPFYWSSHLSKGDVDQLWNHLWNSEVVILGGGNSPNGMWRYKRLGEVFDGEWGKLGRLLHERQQRGLLTVGYSAGADQMCQMLFRATYDLEANAFGVLRNVMVKLHHDPSLNGDLRSAAGRFGHCAVFGLPNDSGLYTSQGVLPSGNWWQVIDFVIDQSWDRPEDGFHIKTRSGAPIEHFYPDGRHWSFRGGDRLVRIQSPDNRFQEAFIGRPGAGYLHYWSQQQSRFGSTEEILGSY